MTAPTPDRDAGFEIRWPSGEAMRCASEEERQRTARSRGYRGVCLVCHEPIDAAANFGMVYTTTADADPIGPIHERCARTWQHPDAESSFSPTKE